MTGRKWTILVLAIYMKISNPSHWEEAKDWNWNSFNMCHLFCLFRVIKKFGDLCSTTISCPEERLNQWKSRLQQQRMEYHDNLHIRPENLFFWLQEFPLISCVVIVISIAPWSCSSDPRKKFLWNAPHPSPFSFPFPIFLISSLTLMFPRPNCTNHE